jgi:hypothetical protein
MTVTTAGVCAIGFVEDGLHELFNPIFRNLVSTLNASERHIIEYGMFAELFAKHVSICSGYRR